MPDGININVKLYTGLLYSPQLPRTAVTSVIETSRHGNVQKLHILCQPVFSP